jgi:REP element-mobilizing transposase RayT
MFDGRGRQSLRLNGFDYRNPGAYFVTICTHRREPLFGEVVDGHLVPGKLARDLGRIWARTVNGGRTPPPWDFVVMPNHVHGIMWLPRRRASERWDIAARVAESVGLVGVQRPRGRDGISDPEVHPGQDGASISVDAAPLLRGFGLPEAGSLGAAVRSFKSCATSVVNRVRRSPGVPVWQRGYYETIISDERHLEATRTYILNNPVTWRDDPLSQGERSVASYQRLGLR